MKRSTDVARHLAWAVAALMLLPGMGRAAGLGDPGGCQREQAAQQRGAQPPGDPHKDDKPGDHPPRPKWWIDPKLRAELNITDQQSRDVDKIWQKSSPSLGEVRERLTKLEDVLSKLTEGNDEAAVIAQSERVESLRAEWNRGRTLMIYRMNKLLTPEQRAKVKAMYDRREPPKRGSGPR